jgi:hypothetical protein
LIAFTISHAFAPFLYLTVTNERFLPTRVASSPTLVTGAKRAPAALLSPGDSTLPDARRRGCLVLGVDASPMTSSERTLQ